MKTNKNIRIIVADDHRLFRSGIISLFDNEPEIFVIGEAENGNELVDQFFGLKPDVLLVDISMPKLSGTDAVIKIRKKDDTVKALFLSMHDGEEYMYYCLKAGGLGFVNKNVMKGELIFAIKEVYGGRKYFGPNINDEDLEKIILKYDSLYTPKKLKEKKTLSPREQEILKLISEGLTSGEIADKLYVSKRTIDSHRANLIQKLNLKSLPDLIKYAIKFTSSGEKS